MTDPRARRSFFFARLPTPAHPVSVASDAKLLVRFDDCAPGSRRASWVELADQFDEELAATLSAELGTPTVLWSIETTVDQIWICGFERGSMVREVLVTPDDGWHTEGKPLPHEDRTRMRCFAARAKAGSLILASPEGYDLLEAFLGGAWNCHPSPSLLAKLAARRT